jgi:hypothetical protein
MDGERQRYTVMARNERYVIMAKPFNAQKTYLYSIADLERGVRGPCDLIFGPPAALDADEGAAIALGMLAAGEMSVSYRRCKPLSDSEATLLRATEPSSGGTA